MQAWSGDHDQFRSKFEAAAGVERKKLLTAENEHGWNALHFSAVYARGEMMKTLLLEVPELVHRPNRRGWLPLHYASGFGHVEMIDLLLGHGAELSCQNNTSAEHMGWTPLHRAFRWWLDPNKRNAIRHLLIKHGADPTALDAHGRSPIDLVSDPCCAPAARLLAEAVATGHLAADVTRQSEATQHRLAHGIALAQSAQK
jgi:ankyrin repeat protein